ncbi:hypothetical protein TcCL_NonESM02820 [Trypanosoma cruzi]|uniref:Uncharacterized protein n=1 Tax=Trypanosoma cruzi (strain CL Brener) TaxID=353153 RepID=Q4DWR7_TRYCC|nr:hypothetical protein, conserved [Trypanosoma cruzi]EAN96977.1 hypothetical protein, conserved [Trypanosoma cruzi]RNC47347.1 hypothetical protein TcCL_NonESM02820 [Trypanosoma cruzi]|eukprot:XP_818828.1 hypothetical protein [Trypanosoma cruzi strain CL Brener]
MLDFIISCGINGAESGCSDFPTMGFLLRLMKEEDRENTAVDSRGAIHEQRAALSESNEPEPPIPTLLKEKAVVPAEPLFTAATELQLPQSPAATMLGFITSSCGDGSDGFPVLQFLNRLLGDEVVPFSQEGDTRGMSRGVPAAKSVKFATPHRLPPERPRPLVGGAAATVICWPTTQVSIKSRSKFTPQATESEQPQGSDGVPAVWASSLESMMGPRHLFVKSDLKDDIGPPILERTATFSPNGNISSREAQDFNSRTISSSVIPCASSELAQPDPCDTAATIKKGFTPPPRPTRSASSNDVVGSGDRASYARRYLQRLYFRDPVVVRPANGPPQHALGMRRKEKESVFGRCFYDFTKHIFTPPHTSGLAAVSHLKNERRLNALSNLGMTGARQGSSRTSSCSALSQPVGHQASPRATSSFRPRSHTRRAWDPRRPVKHQAQGPEEHKAHQDEVGGGLVVEGRALVISSRQHPPALVRQLRRRKEPPCGQVNKKQLQ